jgi:hypothetical protein
MDGGHLRDLFADGLDQAAGVLNLPALAGAADEWRHIASRWHAHAETALPQDIPTIARLLTLTASVTGALAEGDATARERADAARKLWRLREDHADAPPFDDERYTKILAEMSGHLAAIHDAEAAAVTRLSTVIVG